MVELRDQGEEESTWERTEQQVQVGSDSPGQGRAAEVSLESKRQDVE
jgi:hypothetical protein